MYILLDFDKSLPVDINITNSKTTDNKRTHDISLLKNSIIITDPFTVILVCQTFGTASNYILQLDTNTT